MATIYTPWQSPPTDSTLQTPLASFDINGMEGPEDAPEMEEAGDSESGAESGHGDAMSQALTVIQQQSDLISQLMAMMSGKK